MQLLNWRDVIGKPSIIGEFDVYIESMGMTIYNFRAIRTKKGSIFAAPPAYSREYAGQKKFYPYFTFSTERQKEWDAKINELMKGFVK